MDRLVLVSNSRRAPPAPRVGSRVGGGEGHGMAEGGEGQDRSTFKDNIFHQIERY